jgi:RNA polymerase sigma factor (sigma-70 family)
MLNEVLRDLHKLTDVARARDLNDGELLERFRVSREEAAFTVLVQRHGPMVWGVCRRILADPHDAEDAFQATFLVLVRKAGSIHKLGSVGSWLYGVACRVAVKARTRAATRRAQERRFVDMPRPDPVDERTWLELRAVLDEELSQLPEKYRAPVVLCYLEGKTHDEAARQLGCPRSSLSSRLGRARALLRQRLARRGLALTAGVLAAALAHKAGAAGMPALLMLFTIRAATRAAAGTAAAAGAVSPQVAALAEGVIETMSATKATVAAVFVLALTLSASTTLVLGRPAQTPLPPEPPREAVPAPSRGEAPSCFRDATPGSGVHFTYHNGEEADHYTLLESVGGGVGLIDYDGDGLLDLFLPGGGSFAGEGNKRITGRPCKLYRNLGKFRFKDETKEVGLDKVDFYTHGCAVTDYDRDGWPDLLVTGYGRLALYHNESDGRGGRRFVDVTRKAGLLDSRWSTSAAWADLDGDGYPDLYVCRYADWSFDNNPVCSTDGKRDICPPKRFNALPHQVYHNNGDGTFTDASKEAGLRDTGKGLGVIAVDVNADGKPDVFVANDTVANFLYVNRSVPGKIRLEEVGLVAGVAHNELGTPTGSKGLEALDYDNTGRPALWVTNYEGEVHSLFHNERGGSFRFTSRAAGIAALGQLSVGWGTGALDLDHDGWLDLFITNGHVLRFPGGKAAAAQRPTLLRNQAGKFVDISDRGGPYFRGVHRGRGAALGDLDNDGRIDLVISHLNEPVVLLRNEARTAPNHWLGVELAGRKQRDVAGARLVLEVEGLRPQTRFAKGGGSFASAGDGRHVFGLGKAKRPGKLTVYWPSGKVQSWEGLEADRYWRLVEGEKEAQKSGVREEGEDKP